MIFGSVRCEFPDDRNAHRTASELAAVIKRTPDAHTIPLLAGLRLTLGGVFCRKAVSRRVVLRP
jgi:hypothetical protein